METYEDYLKYYKNYKKELGVFLLLTVMVGVFYGNTLLNGFIHDDHGQIEQNIYIQKWGYLPRVLSGCIWEAALGDCKVSSYYRPIQSLSYLLTYQVSPNPWFFHLINLLYFTISSFLTFILVRLLAKNFFVALVSAILFTVHPINTESVNWLATVPELTYTIFILLSTIYWFKYRTEMENDKKRTIWPTNKNIYLSYVFFGLGLISKEPAVFLPFIFVLLDLTFFKKKISDFFSQREFLSYAIFPIIFAVYMATRFAVLGGLGAGLFYSVTNIQRFYAFVDLFADYLKKLFYPINLNLFYEFTPSYKFYSLHFAGALSLVSGFFALFIWSFIKKWKIVSFSLLWILAFLFPALAFINSLGENVFSERYVFASSIGFAVLVAFILEKLWSRGDFLKTVTLSILVIIIIPSFFSVFKRNLLWRMDRIIYGDALVKNPQADLIKYNLAVDLRDKKQLTLSKNLFEEVAERGLWRDIYKAYNNLGDLERRDGNYEKATYYFKKSLTINPNHKEAYNNLGAIQLEKGGVLESLTYFCKALQIDPNFRDAKANFDRISSMTASVDDTNFVFLFQDILHGGAFKESSSSNQLIFKEKDCSNPQGCLYTFNARFKENEFLFPFLIVARTDKGEAIRIRYSSFDPQKSEAILGIDKKFQEEVIEFMFPNCNGTYFKALALEKKETEIEREDLMPFH